MATEVVVGHLAELVLLPKLLRLLAKGALAAEGLLLLLIHHKVIAGKRSIVVCLMTVESRLVKRILVHN